MGSEESVEGGRIVHIRFPIVNFYLSFDTNRTYRTYNSYMSYISYMSYLSYYPIRAGSSR
jgi:hypothetical protein